MTPRGMAVGLLPSGPAAIARPPIRPAVATAVTATARMALRLFMTGLPMVGFERRGGSERHGDHHGKRHGWFHNDDDGDDETES